MSLSAVIAAPDLPAPRDEVYSALVAWMRDLEEFRQAGMVSPEDFGLLRAEKLAELTCRLRGLWLGPVVAGGSFAAVAGCIVWLYSHSWQATGAAMALAAIFGLAMLGRVCREEIRHSQIEDRRKALQSLLEHDLLSADEYMDYEDRLLAGE